MNDRSTIINVLREIASDKSLLNHADYWALICGEAAELLETAKEMQEPRVMTLAEVLATEVVYAEDIDKAEIIPVLVSRRAHDCIVLVRAHLMGSQSRVIYPLISEYGKRWRCWTFRPTAAERVAAAWN